MKSLLAVFGFTILSLSLAKPLLAEEYSRPILAWSRFNSVLSAERSAVPPLATEQDRWALSALQSYAILSPPPGRGGVRAALTVRVRQPLIEGDKTEITPGIALTLYPGKP